MAKSNPLFVDSTLLHGDRIGTQIELSGVLLYDDEALFAMVTNHLGEKQSVPMKLGEEGNYQARVWLSHQKTITCRFVIERSGAMLFQSATYQGRAQYAMLIEWQPFFGEPAESLPPRGAVAPAVPASVPTTTPAAEPVAETAKAKAKAKPAETTAPESVPGRPLTSEYTRGVASLIEKWGL